MFLMFILLRCFLLVAVTEEYLTSYRTDVGNGNMVLSAVAFISVYSAMTLIQNIGRVVVLNIILGLPSFAISSS